MERAKRGWNTGGERRFELRLAGGLDPLLARLRERRWNDSPMPLPLLCLEEGPSGFLLRTGPIGWLQPLQRHAFLVARLRPDTEPAVLDVHLRAGGASGWIWALPLLLVGFWATRSSPERMGLLALLLLGGQALDWIEQRKERARLHEAFLELARPLLAPDGR